MRGLNGPVKRSRVFAHLKSLKAEVVFLQETHLRTKDQVRLRKGWVGQVFHSGFDSKSRGVAIIMGKKTRFVCAKEVRDPGGRYVMVSGVLEGAPVVMVNVYAPNWDDGDFMKKLLAEIPDLATHRLIMGGDFNCVLEPKVDRSNPRSAGRARMAKELGEFMEKMGMVDPWRFHNPGGREYSFFSQVHKVYSRIDYFVVSREVLRGVEGAEYAGIVISDHAPHWLDVRLRSGREQRPGWRLDTGLLREGNFVNKIRQAIRNYVELNQNGEVSAGIFWEALKAVVRGEIIAFTVHADKERRGEYDRLVNEIVEVDREYSRVPTVEGLARRKKLQGQFERLTTGRAVGQLTQG